MERDHPRHSDVLAARPDWRNIANGGEIPDNFRSGFAWLLASTIDTQAHSSPALLSHGS